MSERSGLGARSDGYDEGRDQRGDQYRLTLYRGNLDLDLGSSSDFTTDAAVYSSEHGMARKESLRANRGATSDFTGVTDLITP